MRDEPVRLDAVPALEHLHHRRLQVVVTDPDRDPTEVLERPDVTVEEHLLALVQIRDRGTPDPTPRAASRTSPPRPTRRPDRRSPTRNRPRPPHPKDDAGGPSPRPAARLLAPADLGHVAAHRRLAHLGSVLLDQALPHPPGRVALLARRTAGPPRATPRSSASTVQRRRRPLGNLPRRRHRGSQAPGAHPADAHGTAAPAPGPTAPHARGPCGSVRRASPSTSSASPTVDAGTPTVDPPKWGQIR